MPLYIKKSLPSLVLFIIGLIIYILIPSNVRVIQTGVNARTFPYICTIIIMIGSLSYALITMIQGFYRAKKQRKEEKTENKAEETGLDEKAYKKERLKAYLRVLSVFAFIVLWILLLKPLGYLIVTASLTSAIMLVMGNRKPLQIIIISIVLSVLTYYIFKTLLYINLPAGIINLF